MVVVSALTASFGCFESFLKVRHIEKWDLAVFGGGVAKSKNMYTEAENAIHEYVVFCISTSTNIFYLQEVNNVN
jgi:hypothetical protein